jgi:hypothetical protein
VPAGSAIDHFVLAFAGHGLTGINDDTTYWLMSDSLDQGYSIFVEDLRRQLYAYGIQHLTIFSDACRAIASSRDLRSLLPRPGVRKRHQTPLAGIEVARFNACQDATSAFMVKVPGAAAPGKCIFSGVLAEALWGRVPAAFDGKVIDSSSLGRGLRAAAKERAEQYKLTLVPGGSAFFDRVIYFNDATPPLPPDPELTPWPPADATEPAGAGVSSVEAEAAPAPNVFKSVLTDVAVRTAVLGATFGLDHIGFVAGAVGFPGLPDSAKSLVEHVSQLRRRLDSSEITKPHKKVLSDQMADQLKTLEALAAGEARKQKAKRLRVSLRRAMRPEQDQPRIIIEGSVTQRSVTQIWSDAPVVTLDLNQDRDRTTFTLMGDVEALVMIEFADGLFAPVYYYPDLICTMLRDEEGVAAVSYRHIYADKRSTEVAANVISRVVTGDLSVAEIDNLAMKLRYDKHVNPVFGAIAAYCYDVTGDLNSIRRMAAFYGQRGQASPYDIVHMGMIENDGAIAHVAEVPEDSRRRAGKPPRWLTERTAPQNVRIAGRCPWLRQGWDFLTVPEDTGLSRVDGLYSFRGELTASVFTTLKRDGGSALAVKWQLQPWLTH